MDTKIIHCVQCHKKMEVGKFAAKKQVCASCQAGPAKPVTPRQKMEKAQRLLSSLGFTMTDSNKWSKQYSDASGISYRLEPYFHKGAVKGMEDCTIEAFQVISQRLVMMKPTAANAEEQWATFQEKVPPCTHEDMSVIWTSMIGGTVTPTTEEHQAVEAVICEKCKKSSIEFVILGLPPNRRVLCAKCANMSTKIVHKTAAG
jgi:hypothetical protein